MMIMMMMDFIADLQLQENNKDQMAKFPPKTTSEHLVLVAFLLTEILIFVLFVIFSKKDITASTAQFVWVIPYSFCI